MKYPLLLLLFLSLSKIGRAERYIEYSGSQVWPTNKAAVPDTHFAEPVYHGCPERPYLVAGAIRSSGNAEKWQESDTTDAALLAKTKGADAIIVWTGEDMAALVSPAADRHLLEPAETGALAIKWKPQSAVDEASHRMDGFRAYMRRSYPLLALDSKKDLWAMGAEYVAWLGMEIDSEQGRAKLEDIFSGLQGPTANSSPSRWLFKAMLQPSDSTASPAERIIYGVATLTQTGEEVDILSDPAGPTIHFSGQSKAGALSGKIELPAGADHFSGKADGELAPAKAALHCEGQTAAGSSQANITLVR